MRDEARPVERARFEVREALADQERRGRTPVEKARRERERESHRRGPVRGRGRDDLVQAVLGEAAAERGIERAREGHAPSGARPRADEKPAFASISAMTRRKCAASALPPGDIRFFPPSLYSICSSFDPMRGESQKPEGTPFSNQLCRRTASTRLSVVKSE